MSDSTNPNAIGTGMAIVWFLLCMPIGFATWSQAGKGFIWVLISIFTGGIGGFAAMVDYWMCFSVQQKRALGDWEFFPSK